MRFFVECGDFFRESRRHFRDTGSVLPSSRFLARALIAELRRTRGPCRILEVGPGTGSVTAQIVRHLLPGDRLDAIEINGHFVEMLRRRIDQEWPFWLYRDQIRVLQGAVQELNSAAEYDLIISGLPLNNFPASQVREIFRVYNRLLKPGGLLSYYEYVLIRQLKTPFVNQRERRRLSFVGRVVRHYIRAHQVRREQVFMNVPPAIVRHLRLKPAGAVGLEAPLQDTLSRTSSARL
jgi:phospholipid N-methyltransferase